MLFKFKIIFLKKLFAILLLLNFLVFILPVSTNKTLAKQFSTSMPSEEENGASKGFDINEFGIKLLHPIHHYTFSNDIFYLLAKERFSHYTQHTFPVDWLETFSPPPDAV